MEEYLQCMKTLRSQMTDVEDHAAKVSVEEQMQITTIDTLQKDLDHALCETKRLKEETDQKTRTKGELCSQILGKQRKISSMESDSANLAQSLELILQERDSISAKLVSKRSNYIKTAEEAKTKLEEQKGWFVSHMSNETGQQRQKEKSRKNLMGLSDSARAKLDQAKQMRSELIQENSKIKLSIENVKNKINDFKPELMPLDIKILEEEYTALLSDESGEAEYLHSLQRQAEKLKGISYIAKCGCGEEYSVGLY
ncbi:hypothetical protein BRARA_E01883 [Brassica rapa]|uniref:BnaA05g17850D protein n=2 Tax=Brassica TaxID=3705 RepID=A0A078GP20_BRANA|nr:uncharacterized protein LOC103874785 [Brassica rapa]XP_013672537.1 uncharacterized protein BNAA05G17850D [Brassica napus]XP_033147547.1 uncharacterized protein LOC103874785 [Brassica rapa]RID62840.1 hypothetical protein BRARA_E01883 [Brassica rapa]CAG7876441.1 unnamed protein product [Brassica rapa]CDY26927.1 BnaA05g17850D [Brassica napus]